MRAVLSEYLSLLPHFVPTLASLDPSCERFHSECLNSLCSDCELYFTCFEFEMSCMSVIRFHLRFIFTRLPSSRRCGLAETVGLCFRVDSDRATLVFVLGLVCVCVCVYHLNRCKTSDWFSLICRGVVSNDEVTTQRRRFIICCDMTKGRLCHVPAFFGHSKGPS